MRLLQRTLRHSSRFSTMRERAYFSRRRGCMRRLVFLGVACLALVACGHGTKSGIGGDGDGYIFDPCVSDPKPGYDPKAAGLDACCDDGPAHCVPNDEI